MNVSKYFKSKQDRLDEPNLTHIHCYPFSHMSNIRTPVCFNNDFQTPDSKTEVSNLSDKKRIVFFNIRQIHKICWGSIINELCFMFFRLSPSLEKCHFDRVAVVLQRI